MFKLISQTRQKARKQYSCMTKEWMEELDDLSELNFSEKRAIVRAIRNKWKIQKGDTYLRQFCRGDDGVYSFICNEELHNICLKLDLYQE